MKAIRDICRNFCNYYKPGKKEELACRGYLVAERLLRQGMQVVLFTKTGSQCDGEGAELIVRKLCVNCDFKEDGCDFINDRNAPPCGGFALLSQLLAERRISLDDI